MFPDSADQSPPTVLHAQLVDEPPAVPRSTAARMFESLLDPKVIGRLLVLGGGLFVAGVVIWLASVGVFDNSYVMAASLGGGSLALLGGGWWVSLKTNYKLAGQALTFLACVVLPLNLGFYHAQHLLRVEQNLWIGGVVCAGLYLLTVRRLRDPLFMYAFSAGVTLTAMLLLASVGVMQSFAWLAASLVSLAAISIHAYFAFPKPGEVVEFDRRRYGMPLVRSGLVQMFVGLVILGASQLVALLPEVLVTSVERQGWNFFSTATVATITWLAAGYLFLFTALVIDRRRPLFFAAAMCGLAAQMTAFIALNVPEEYAVSLLAVTALAANLLEKRLTVRDGFESALSRLGVFFSALPVACGAWLMLVYANFFGIAADWWPMTVNLLIATVCSAATVFLRRESRFARKQFVLHASIAAMAAFAGLTAMGIANAPLRTALLMTLPIGYIAACKLPALAKLRGTMYGTAQVLAVAALGSTFIEPLGEWFQLQDLVNHRGQDWTVIAMFAAAAVFFVIAGRVLEPRANSLAATTMAAAAVWQLAGRYNWTVEQELVFFAVAGVVAIIIDRLVSLIPRRDTSAPSTQQRATRTFALVDAGNALVSVSIVGLMFKCLAAFAVRGLAYTNFAALLGAIAVCLLAAAVSKDAAWRRWYVVCAIAVGTATLVGFSLHSKLSGWRKVEIGLVLFGLSMLIRGYVGRFQQSRAANDDTPAALLWLGSLLVALPQLVTSAISQLGWGHIAWYDELPLIVLSTAMLATGVAWQVKSTTLLGGFSLGSYLLMLVAGLTVQANLAAGVYLTVGGGVLFLCGALLAIYRERLQRLPQRVADREGLFQVLDWR